MRVLLPVKLGGLPPSALDVKIIAKVKIVLKNIFILGFSIDFCRMMRRH